MPHGIRERLRQAYRLATTPKPGLGIGVIGLGYGSIHVAAYAKAGWRVVAVCDTDPARLERHRSEGTAICVDDWRLVVEHPEVEIVDLAISQPGRVEIVEVAARAGKHVLIQKPFAHRIADAITMVDVCHEAGVKLGVNQNARYAACNRATKWLLDQDAIGEPFFMHQLFVLNSDAVDHRFWSTLEYFALAELSVHYLDLLRWWAGREPEYVSASLIRSPSQRLRGELGSIVTMEFSGGLRGHLTDQNAVIPPSTSEHPWAMQLRIDGTQGSVVGGYDVLPSAGWQTNMHLALWSEQYGSEWHRWQLDDLAWIPDAHIGTMGEMMDAIAADREPSISGRDNLNTVRLLLAAYLSADEKRSVRPNEIQPGVDPLPENF